MSSGLFRNPTLWLVGLVLVGIAWLLVLMSEPVKPYLARGDTAPFFRLPSLGEDTPVDSSRFSGAVTLVNFWATWCKPCEEEMPAMQALYEALSPDGFSLLAISVDKSRDDVEAFQERLGLGFPILLDPNQEISALYQTTGFPESFLVGPDGRIVERYVGPREWDHPDYVARVNRLLEGVPKRPPMP
ncbi:MAG: TlpA disulfide reductase family protein [Myxococcota bacterium]|nr:TlpA disulfide reductase family protein [Myxococcota bacterium]